MSDYEFKPDSVDADAVERADEADNPPVPEPSVGDEDASPVSEEEVTEHGFPAVNNASTSPVPADSEADEASDTDDEN